MQDQLLPQEYVSLMQQHALDACPVSPYASVRQTIEQQLGAPAEQVFRSFEREPLASASLAQVHRAMLHDGRPVAVKVQHALLRDTALADMATIRCSKVLALVPWAPQGRFASLQSVRGAACWCLSAR